MGARVGWVALLTQRAYTLPRPKNVTHPKGRDLKPKMKTTDVGKIGWTQCLYSTLLVYNYQYFDNFSRFHLDLINLWHRSL